MRNKKKSFNNIIFIKVFFRKKIHFNSLSGPAINT